MISAQLLCNRSRLVWTAFLLAILLLPCPSRATTSTSGKLVIVSWDAAADWIMDRLLAENKMPNVAKLARQGVRADYVVPPFPSITAPSHAALWTAVTPDVNGITYNKVSMLPKSEHTILDTMSGFDSVALLAEPIWMPVVKSGRRAFLLSATQSLPIEPYYAKMKAAGIPKDRLVSVTGRFGSPQAPAEIY